MNEETPIYQYTAPVCRRPYSEDLNQDTDRLATEKKGSFRQSRGQAEGAGSLGIRFGCRLTASDPSRYGVSRFTIESWTTMFSITTA